MKTSLNPELDQDYRWVISHYDNVVSSEVKHVRSAYTNALLSTAVGLLIWIWIRASVQHEFINSKQFLYIVVSLSICVFIFYGKQWSKNAKIQFGNRKFNPKAVAYIPKVAPHLKSDFGKKLSADILLGKTVYMWDIKLFVDSEKRALNIPPNTRLKHINPSKSFITANIQSG